MFSSGSEAPLALGFELVTAFPFFPFNNGASSFSVAAAGSASGVVALVGVSPAAAAAKAACRRVLAPDMIVLCFS